MPYCQLYYHLVWATKLRLPLLTPEVEPMIYGYIRSKAIGLGATVYALNGVEDHVHMVVSIPPAVAVARFVGQVKATASTRFNKSGVSEARFLWQAEYAAFSFDRRRLPNYVAYVRGQKGHHRTNQLIPILETTENVTRSGVAEASEEYGTDQLSWQTEMLSLF